MSKKLVTKTSKFRIYSLETQLPNREKEIFEYVSLFGDTLDAVMVAPLTKERELIFIEQFWPAMNKRGLLFPGGRVDTNESLVIAAKRELAEEIHLYPKKLINLGRVEILPKYLYGQTHFYLAMDLKEEHSFKGDEKEEPKIIKMPLKKAILNIKKGNISDSRTVALALLVINHLQ